MNDATGEIAQQIDYDTWGNILSDTSPGFQPFGFAGGLYDPDTRLVHFGARDYSASIGRWIESDPALFSAGDTNLYAYASDDPINGRDPTGLAVELCMRVADLPGNQVFRVQHWWIRTSLVEAGLGPAGGGVPGEGGSDSPYVTDTTVNPHPGRGNQAGSTCIPQPDVNEPCVNTELLSRIGKSQGRWTPWNQCQTIAAGILDECRLGRPKWTEEMIRDRRLNPGYGGIHTLGP